MALTVTYERTSRQLASGYIEYKRIAHIEGKNGVQFTVDHEVTGDNTPKRDRSLCYLSQRYDYLTSMYFIYRISEKDKSIKRTQPICSVSKLWANARGVTVFRDDMKTITLHKKDFKTFQQTQSRSTLSNPGRIPTGKVSADIYAAHYMIYLTDIERHTDDLPEYDPEGVSKGYLAANGWATVHAKAPCNEYSVSIQKVRRVPTRNKPQRTYKFLMDLPSGILVCGGMDDFYNPPPKQLLALNIGKGRFQCHVHAFDLGRNALSDKERSNETKQKKKQSRLPKKFERYEIFLIPVSP